MTDWAYINCTGTRPNNDWPLEPIHEYEWSGDPTWLCRVDRRMMQDAGIYRPIPSWPYVTVGPWLMRSFGLDPITGCYYICQRIDGVNPVACAWHRAKWRVGQLQIRARIVETCRLWWMADREVNREHRWSDIYAVAGAIRAWAKTLYELSDPLPGEVVR